MTCDGYYACTSAAIYCPQNALSNINCLGTSSYSCAHTSFHFQNRDDSKFNLQCSTTSSTACRYAYMRCYDSNKTTTLVYSNSTWGCDTSALLCCQLPREDFVCSAGVPCQVCNV